MRKRKTNGRGKSKSGKLKTENKFKKKVDRKEYEKLAKKYCPLIQKDKARARTLKKVELFSVLVILIIAIFAVLLFYKLPITGFAVFGRAEEHVHQVNELFDKNSNYIFVPEVKGEIKSLKINGKVIGEGDARVYLESGNESYLIFEYSKDSDEENQITGMVINEFSEEENNETSQPNESFDSNETYENINETNEINETGGILSENDNPNLIVDLNESISEAYSSNNSLDNITRVPSDAEIIIELGYSDESEFDYDNDGIETKEGIIDFNLDVNFNWDVNKGNLCTVWETYSVENQSSIKVCYGNEKCCNFAGLEPSSEIWDEIFYSYYQRYGATENNRISAQVVYVDYSTSEENPYSDIYYSNWETLDAVFIEDEKITEIKEKCIDTCVTSLNESYYNLKIELEGARLSIKDIVYSVVPSEKKANNPPVLFKNIPNITISEDGYYLINLSKYFNDHEKDLITYDVYDMENIPYSVQENLVRLMPEKGFKGTRHTFITANDSESIAVSNVFSVSILEKDEFFVESAIIKEINKPVKWRKSVFQENLGNISRELNVSFNLPEHAAKVKIFDELDREINNSLVNVKEYGTDKKEIVFRDLIDAKKTKNYYVEYETPAPVSYENEINPARKRIVVSSELHYENVLAYTNITEITSDTDKIKLYWIRNETRYLFDNISYIDQDNDLLIDRIEWIVPHLSNQSFDVEIDVISVYSNPSSGENWTISFNVTGISNLTVSASNRTTYTEIFDDDNSTKDDIEIIELKCGNDTIYNKHTFANDYGFYFKLKNGSLFSLSQTIGEELGIESIFFENFYCNSTSNLTVKLISPGEHYQEINFHGIKSYVKNIPTDIIKTENVYYNSNCPKCEKDYDLNPENFCVMTNHWQEKDDFQAEMSFDVKYVEDVNSAYLCAYNHYNWHGESSINYIEKINESKLSIVSKDFVINDSFVKIEVPSWNGWQCFNITKLAKEAVRNNDSRLDIRWIGEDINGSRGPFSCFRGTAPLEKCDGYNPSGALDCRPYLDIR